MLCDATKTSLCLFQVTETEVQTFKSVLESEVGSLYMFKANMLDLRQIRAPAFTCKSNGQIRIERPDKVKTVLSYLTEICQGSMRTPYPKLSTEEDFVIAESASNY